MMIDDDDDDDDGRGCRNGSSRQRDDRTERVMGERGPEATCRSVLMAMTLRLPTTVLLLPLAVVAPKLEVRLKR